MSRSQPETRPVRPRAEQLLLPLPELDVVEPRPLDRSLRCSRTAPARSANTPIISNDALLWQLDRACEFLNWIDERGGWNDELRRHFNKMMQFSTDVCGLSADLP